MKKYLVLVLIVTGLVWLLYHSTNGYLVPGYHAFFYTKSEYKSFLEEIKEKKEKYKVEYQKADTKEKQEIIEKVQELFLDNTEEIFAYWYGTSYDLNGTSQTPGEGKIACGYFVTTVIRDAGFGIDRVRMAQMASEEAIKKLVDDKKIKRFHKIKNVEFVKAARKQGDGLYVVGLDTHIGFLLIKGKETFFIHSTSTIPHCVIREDAEISPTLRNSKYKVLAKLSDDESFLIRWLD